MFPLLWQSSTPFQRLSLTSVLAKSIQENLVQHSQPSALGFPKLWCHCLALYQIHRQPRRPLWCRLDYPSHHASYANYQCRKCYQVHYHHQVLLDGGQFVWFGGHLIHELMLQGGPLQTKLVAKVIFLTIYMPLHHHVKSLTTMLW